jgi:hypothetical protein
VTSHARVRIVRRCHDCGATPREATFPGTRKPSQIDRCIDCLAELERLAEATPARFAKPAKPIQTRRRYRAAFCYRAKQAQGDLVDLLVPPP